MSNMADMSLTETKEAIQHHGEMQMRLGEKAIKEGRNEDAARHADRADVALDEGMLLHGTAEVSDPNYAMEVQQLLRSADRHKLVKWDLKEPTQA